VCTVRRDVCRKLNNKSVISFTQILFIMPVIKLSRSTVYFFKIRFNIIFPFTMLSLSLTLSSHNPVSIPITCVQHDPPIASSFPCSPYCHPQYANFLPLKKKDPFPADSSSVCYCSMFSVPI